MRLFWNAIVPFLFLFTAACGGQGNSALPDARVPLRLSQNALPLADLSVHMSLNPQRARVGQTVTFTIIATNNGPAVSNLDTHVIPSRKLEIVSIRCAFDVSSDGPFCEPGFAQPGAQFTTVVVARLKLPGRDAMQACVLAEGDTSDPNTRNDCATLRADGLP